jgi:hypothetical protein
VRGLHAQDRSAQSGGAGERLALNLAGDFGKEDIARGMWVVDPALHVPVAAFPRPPARAGGQRGADPALDAGACAPRRL